MLRVQHNGAFQRFGQITVLDSRRDEQRWRAALEQGSFGVWDLDPELDEVHYSPLWKRRMGFSNEHAADSTSFWRCRVHPEDLGLMLDALRIHIDGASPTYEQRFRLRSNGSGYRTVLSRGRVVERDEKGKPTRMFGTMVDLTVRPVRPRPGLPSGALGPPGLGRDMPLHHVLGLESRVVVPAHCAGVSGLGLAAPACPKAQLLEHVYDLLELAGRKSSTEG